MENQSKEVTPELSRYEQKRLEREKNELERQRAQRSKKIRNYVIYAVLLLAMGGGIRAWIRSVNKKETLVKSALQGEQLSNLGQKHVENTDEAEYNSVPPTSGDHFGSQTNWGIHKEPLPEGYQIHNLEHGGVLLQYKPDLAPEIIEKLKAIGESYQWSKIILAPYPPLDKNFALTAWMWLDKFDEFDEARVKAFIDAHRNHGPEKVPDNMPSINLP